MRTWQVSTFWAVFLIDLTLYGYVLFADTRYAEALPGMPDSYPDGESRRCDDCDTDVFHTRAIRPAVFCSLPVCLLTLCSHCASSTGPAQTSGLFIQLSCTVACLFS
ncbi:unnamed protein product [Effrenium voratum]|nr:unnamed protein product [Effrenium voratum]